MIANVTLDIPMDFQSFSFGEQVYRSVLISFSFLINTGVFGVIILSRQLHYPRHIFWAVLALFNNFSLIHWVFEILGIVLKVNFACHIYVLNAGVTYTLLLNCLCLATIDRYMAIAHYDWYKVNVSNRMVISALVLSSSFTYAAGISPFWTGLLSLSSCTVNLAHMHWMLTWDLILGITCVVLDFKVFLLSRALVKAHIPMMSKLPMSMSFVYPRVTGKNAISYLVHRKILKKQGRNLILLLRFYSIDCFKKL